MERRPPSEDDVLDAIFNPNMPFGSANQAAELKGPGDDVEVTEEELNLRKEEAAAIKLAEAGRLDEALEAFTALVEKNPTRASSYNNRAQLHQLKGNKDAAMNDLNFAIDKCILTTAIAQAAYAQRAVLKRVLNDVEGARKDFEMAGKYGNAWARHEAVKLNPYAAMCNQMLKQAVDAMSGKEEKKDTQEDKASTAGKETQAASDAGQTDNQ
eukprot:m.79898 g.79898  ORF g.79898 m.79898 type:complete len:212 (-) comp14187_c1_seq1:189-824(-)